MDTKRARVMTGLMVALLVVVLVILGLDWLDLGDAGYFGRLA